MNELNKVKSHREPKNWKNASHGCNRLEGKRIGREISLWFRMQLSKRNSQERESRMRDRSSV
jgi:hypothetical protein